MTYKCCNVFFIKKHLLITLDKTKMLMLNATQECYVIITRILLGSGKVAYRQIYSNLGVTFLGPLLLSFFCP